MNSKETHSLLFSSLKPIAHQLDWVTSILDRVERDDFVPPSNTSCCLLHQSGQVTTGNSDLQQLFMVVKDWSLSHYLQPEDSESWETPRAEPAVLCLLKVCSTIGLWTFTFELPLIWADNSLWLQWRLPNVFNHQLHHRTLKNIFCNSFLLLQ